MGKYSRKSEPEMGSNERFGAPADDCDVIMKGGITSGVVYPPAFAEIATDH
jgi:hypothetical protein